MNENIGDTFLFQCKQNYLDKITPSNSMSHLKDGYTKLVSIANEYFENDRYEAFAGFLQEGQYFIALWAAHLLLEYGKPSIDLMRTAMKIIVSYSVNPLAQDVAEEEMQWLSVNTEKYKEYL